MTNLDNKNYIKNLDKQHVLSSIENVVNQFGQAARDFLKIKIPRDFSGATDILILGMGGSGLGGHIIQSLFFDKLTVPLRVLNSYTLPKAANKNTLCIIISYSGSTEETLASYEEAKKKKAKIFIITSGGKLAKLAQKDKVPHYVFNPVFNPSGQPRMGLGYLLAAQILFFSKAKFINFTAKEQKLAINSLGKINGSFGQSRKTADNIAKKIALILNQKTPILIGSEFLIGSLHVFANQLNETAKTFATYFSLPELNHHLMEGLVFPRENKKNLFFLMINSPLYFTKIRVRYKITEEVLRRNKIKFLEYKTYSKDKLSQALEILMLGSYVSFYLAILNKIDPAKIPWVDYFKKRISN